MIKCKHWSQISSMSKVMVSFKAVRETEKEVCSHNVSKISKRQVEVGKSKQLLHHIIIAGKNYLATLYFTEPG